MPSKTAVVRNAILSQLEEGTLKGGAQLPGARDLAAQLQVSFLKTQQALETLVKDGILESHGRAGTFVQADWRKRVLHENVSVFNQRHRLPWIDGLYKILEQEMSDLRFTHTFDQSMIEIKTTQYVQTHYDDFLDVSELINDLFPDRSDFFEHAFCPFGVAGKQYGIPFIHSPRVMYYNAAVLREHNCPEPTATWTWSDFMNCIGVLQGKLPDTHIVNWVLRSYYWLNFIIRSGGHLMNVNNDSGVESVVLDSDNVLQGLSRFRELGGLINNVDFNVDNYMESFIAGESAFLIAGRQQRNAFKQAGYDGWACVALPQMSSEVDCNSQATDVICVRKSCTDLARVKTFFKVMLSSKVQDYIAAENYGIPIRKSSAFKSLDLSDSRDVVFLTELKKTVYEPLSQYSQVARIIYAGINQLLIERSDLKTGLERLSRTASEMLKIQGFSRSEKNYPNEKEIS